MCNALAHVRFTPNSDIDCAFRHDGPKGTLLDLLDHLICSVEQTIWNGEAQRFGGLEIDH
jgi:hypothetical protein